MTTLLTLYSNGNAITCSDMLKILFFTDTWISYFIPSPGRTLSAGTLGLPTFVSLNEIQHFMITMSCCMCLVTFCESNLHLSVTPLHHIIMAKRNLSKIHQFYIQIYIYHQKHIWNDAESLDLLYYFLFYESHIEANSLRSCFLLMSFFISCCLSEDAHLKLHLLFEFFHCTLKQM